MLEASPASLGDVAAALHLSAARARRQVASLEAKGLLARSAQRPPRYIAAPPGDAFELIILRRQEELQRARTAVAGLVQVSRRRTHRTAPDELVEVVSGREAIAQRFVRLQRAATTEVVGFDKPPYTNPSTACNPTEMELLQRGVAVRGIYAREVLEMPGSLAMIREWVAAGEQARVLDSLPLKMVIADRREALVPLNLSEPGMEGAIAIHASPLLEALTVLFETLWEKAAPIGQMAEPGDPEPTGRPEGMDALLVLLAAGLKDDDIARQLKIAPRTLDRRLQQLMAELGTRTRFQTAVVAIERRWLQREAPGGGESARSVRNGHRSDHRARVPSRTSSRHGRAVASEPPLTS